MDIKITLSLTAESLKVKENMEVVEEVVVETWQDEPDVFVPIQESEIDEYYVINNTLESDCIILETTESISIS